MDDKDKEKTAFTTGERLWHFIVMPFGPSNAPATFERLMEEILHGLPWSLCMVYLDDVIVHARNFTDFFKILLVVQVSPSILKRLTLYKWLYKWPDPKNKSEVRSFIGLSTYYRRFVPRFTDIARPLLKLTEKDCAFCWTEECQEAFEKLKELLTSTPILAYPNVNNKFCLDTDASDYAIGAVLSQKQDVEEREFQLLPLWTEILGKNGSFGIAMVDELSSAAMSTC
jgi:hypothetical protein